MRVRTLGEKAVTAAQRTDWPWDGRDYNDLKSVWHNVQGKPVWPMLFGDGHVIFYKFPPTITSMYSVPGDLNYTWW